MSNVYKLDAEKNIHLRINSDLSGCQIYRDEECIATISGYLLLEIVADYVRMQKISELEDQGYHEILGLEEGL